MEKYTDINIISLETIPSQSFNVNLDNKNCNIKLISWKENVYIWLTVDEEIILSGYACVCNVKLNQFKQKLLPGSLIFLNTTTDGTQPDYKLFNDKYKLIYLPRIENV